MTRYFLMMAAAAILLGAVPAHAATTVAIGGPAAAAINATGYNNYGAAAGAAVGNAAASAVQPSQGGQMQNYSKMMNGQGAAYGQQAQGDQAQGQKKYRYVPRDPNDPLANVTLPDRLYHNDQAHIYHGDDCSCSVAGPY